MCSLPQLEPDILQLSVELRISLIPTLANSLAKSFPPSLKTHFSQQEDFKTVLLAMPNVGEDSDFTRVNDHGRELELST